MIGLGSDKNRDKYNCPDCDVMSSLFLMWDEKVAEANGISDTSLMVNNDTRR